MGNTLVREPGYYGRPHYEREAWVQFGKRRLPNYDRFWQAFVMPRIRPTAPYIKYLTNVSPEERWIVHLHQTIFRLFNRIYTDKPFASQYVDWRERYHILCSFNRLGLICDNFEKLLLAVLALNDEMSEHQAVAKQYIQRLHDRRVKIKAMHVPGKLYGLFDSPKQPAKVTVLASELKVVQEAYDLGVYNLIAKQIRLYRDTVNSLDSFDIGGIMIIYDSIPPMTEVDEKKLHNILGKYDSMQALIVDQADLLLKEINEIYGRQLVRFAKKYKP